MIEVSGVSKLYFDSLEALLLSCDPSVFLPDLGVGVQLNRVDPKNLVNPLESKHVSERLIGVHQSLVAARPVDAL